MLEPDQSIPNGEVLGTIRQLFRNDNGIILQIQPSKAVTVGRSMRVKLDFLNTSDGTHFEHTVVFDCYYFDGNQACFFYGTKEPIKPYSEGRIEGVLMPSGTLPQYHIPSQSLTPSLIS